ncbi:MAG: PAS domain-containing protein, partial [Pikeienuella sp.]
MSYKEDADGKHRRPMTQNDTVDGFELKHPGSRRLFEYWSDLRAGRSAPYKAEVTAQGIGRTLASNTFILENLGDGNLRFRLAGSHLFNIFGLEVRGMSALSIMNDASRTRFRALISDAMQSVRVGVCRAAAITPDGDKIMLEMIFAPLRSDFDQMNRMLGAVHVLDMEDDAIIRAPRRCDILASSSLSFGADQMPEHEGALPGFADKPTGFIHDAPPPLVAIDGGADARQDGSPPRRGHL